MSQEVTTAQCGNQDPSQEPQDHRVQAARTIFSQIHRHDPKASNDAVMWHVESRNRNQCESHLALGGKKHRQFFSSGVLHEKKSIAQKTTNTNHKGRNADPLKQRPNKNNHNQDFPGHSGEKPLCREKTKEGQTRGLAA